MLFQNAVIPKRNIKQDKEVVVKEFSNFGANIQSDDLNLKIKKTNQNPFEFFEIEIENVGVFEGTIRNNNMFGIGRLFDSKKRLVFEGEFLHNLFEGLGIQYNFSEERYQRTQMGLGMTLPLDWIRYEGLFHEGKKSGIGTLYFADGSRYYGDFDKDQANGYGSYFKGNEVVRGFWNNNLHKPN